MEICKPLKVEIVSPDGNAIFTFRRPKMNEDYSRSLEDQEALGKLDDVKDMVEKTKILYSIAMRDLVAVEGLTEDGKPLGVEALKSLDVDLDTMRALLHAKAQAGVKEDPEKKDSKSA